VHFEIRDDVNPALLGTAWLLGTWEGNGHGSWPGAGDFEFGQRIDFSTNGGPFLHYVSQTWTLDGAGQPLAPLTMEDGFWRPGANGDLEIVVAHPEGIVEVWAGRITGTKIEVTTDLVARTRTGAPAVTGGQRLYGNVEGDLLYAWDRAAEGVPLQPYLWARLRRAPAGPAEATDAGPSDAPVNPVEAPPAGAEI